MYRHCSMDVAWQQAAVDKMQLVSLTLTHTNLIYTPVHTVCYTVCYNTYLIHLYRIIILAMSENLKLNLVTFMSKHLCRMIFILSNPSPPPCRSECRRGTAWTPASDPCGQRCRATTIPASPQGSTNCTQDA